MWSDPFSKDDRQLTAYKAGALLFIVGGVALVLLLLFRLSPPLDISKSVPGRTEERFRAKAELLAARAGAESLDCSYWGKEFTLTCTFRAPERARLVQALAEDNWTVGGGSLVLGKSATGTDRAMLRCSQQAGSFACELKQSLALR